MLARCARQRHGAAISPEYNELGDLNSGRLGGLIPLRFRRLQPLQSITKTHDGLAGLGEMFRQIRLRGRTVWITNHPRQRMEGIL